MHYRVWKIRNDLKEFQWWCFPSENSTNVPGIVQLSIFIDLPFTRLFVSIDYLRYRLKYQRNTVEKGLICFSSGKEIKILTYPSQPM